MAAKIRLTNGSGVSALVTGDQELLVTQATYPPLAPQKVQPFRAYLKDSAQSIDMGVDGSVTPIDFYVSADEDSDRYITKLSILVGYAAAGAPFEWADGTALTNGMRVYYLSQRGGVDIHDGIKKNEDMFRLGDVSFLPTDWEVRSVGALNDYGYLMSVDFTKLFPTLGLKLDAGTTQKLCMTVRDNATAATTFNVIAYGFDRFK